MAFYKDVVLMGEKLEAKGWKVLYPITALEMKKKNDFNVNHFKKHITVAKKRELIRLHFEKIKQADAILVVNKTKNGIRGYIGPNVLMEIGLAFDLGIDTYLLHPFNRGHSFHEELTAIAPTILGGKLDKLLKG